jgi:hypothetical protein
MLPPDPVATDGSHRVGASPRNEEKRRGPVAGAPTSAFHLVAGPPSGDVLPRCVHRDESVSTAAAESCHGRSC